MLGVEAKRRCPTLTSDGSEMKTAYTYTKGRLTKIVSGDSTYTFTYDIWGNVLTVKLNNQALATYAYGDYASKGQVQTLTYGNGKKVYYTYDALGQVSTVGYTGQLNRFEYTYATVEDDSYAENVYGRVIKHVFENDDDTTILSVNDSLNNRIFGAVSKTDGFGQLEYKNVFTDKLNIKHNFGYIGSGEDTGNLVTEYDINYVQGTRAIMYTVSNFYRNGNKYKLEVLFDWDTMTVRHFKYWR